MQISGSLKSPSQLNSGDNLDIAKRLLQAGSNDAAIAILDKLVSMQPDNLLAREYLFDAYFQSRRWSKAIEVNKRLLELNPNSGKYWQQRLHALNNNKDFDQAAALGERLLGQRGEDPITLNTLKICFFNLGRTDAAIRCGQRSMELADKQAWKRRQGSAPSVNVSRQDKKLISFSLWGANAIYNYGAIINCRLARKHLPGWICRFYVGPGVPQTVKQFLFNEEAEIVEASMHPETPLQCLRFLPLADDRIARVIFRDCDSRLGSEEAELVGDWLESGYPYHVIRAHVLHNELILAGLWGGCGGAIEIEKLIAEYFSFAKTNKYGHDQKMLGSKVWPLIRNRCLVHDRFYELAGVETRKLDDRFKNLGAGYQKHEAVLQEAAEHGIEPLKELVTAPVWR